MVAYLLDTNHASPLVTPGHPLPRRVHERVAAGDTFAICVPVLTETLFGLSLLPRGPESRRVGAVAGDAHLLHPRRSRWVYWLLAPSGIYFWHS